MKSVEFVKYSGCGNDFILIDNRYPHFQDFSGKFIKKLCERRVGIGADGFISLETSNKADFRMRIFNADGYEAEMCGNGLRCLARFIQEDGFSKKCFSIETMHHCLNVEVHKKDVSVEIPKPTLITTCLLDLINKKIYSVNTGVPHAVIFVEDLEDKNLFKIAPSIRSHSSFGSSGTNVNFAKVYPNQFIAIRTYERGVEGETLACGTGAVAVAFISMHALNLKTPISIQTRSGEFLKILYDHKFCDSENPILIGPAKKIFQGEIDISLLI